MSNAKVRAVVAGHGDFATGMISAVDQITGRGDVFASMTNRDLSVDDITRNLESLIDHTGAGVVFTDLPAGSATVAARRVQRTHTDLVVVTAISLPVLLDFVFQGDLAAADAARHAVEKGHGALAIVGLPGAR
jgi:PTS system N-acetylgalactosamine-specific IIA component